MKKINTVLTILLVTSAIIVNAQNELSSSWLNPQFKPGNLLQNFNKPLNTHVPEIRSANPSSPLVPIYDSTYYWQWNAAANTWNYSTKIIDIAYNFNNLETHSLYQNWTGSNWENTMQTSVTYNSTNLVTNEVTQSWSGTGWVNASQTMNNYNQNNLETSSILQIWSGTDWVNSLQQTITYNSTNLETSDVKQVWSGSKWINYSQSVTSYNSFNDLVSSLFQLWDSTGWINRSQTLNTYNSYDQLINSLSQYWTGAIWMNYSQTAGFIYNSNNDAANFSAQVWNGNTWVHSGEIANNFDANDITVSYSIKNINAAGTITAGDSTHYYFSKTATAGVNDISGNSEIKLYPNPANNIIHVVITLKQPNRLQLRLVNILGQTMWTADAGNTSTYQSNIPVANLSNGVYLFELITGNGTQSQKVVVTH